ncbi:putative aminopeptidase [Povalibacter uvarum]|uniref:Putative aminopeptidase n=1 Tax=Povalibacter uvarum TaxID=732238 RepID=A0A841HV97_9GAMM|nr:aminopeptidase [Povalibacter uvarum]MBB6096179.1 putative aminopeptidase [Povalibacter uvarum]
MTLPPGSHRLFALLLLPLLHGCYLLQAAGGQMEIVSKREPIDQVLANPATPDKLRARLEYVSAARDFASRELGLPDNPSYRSYADLQRPYVVWNVFATDEFSIEPRRWCFPIAGCVVYRGYFNEESAQSYARKMRMNGGDAMVGGVAAYSTLGHFRDPILNTMMGWSDAQLASTLFHELAHQVVYVPGDSEFNEAFATAVEEAGLERWLNERGRSQDMLAWRRQKERQQEFIDLLLGTREKLKELYASKLPADEMRARKAEVFGRLKFDYAQLRAQWNGFTGYDWWFDRALGNAHLVSAATYHGCLPGFQRLLASLGGDLPKFYEEVGRIAKLPKAERERSLCGGE